MNGALLIINVHFMYLNPEQAAYIDQLRADGSRLNVGDLQALLNESGWPEHEVAEALQRYTGNRQGTEPSTPAVPASTAVSTHTEGPSNSPNPLKALSDNKRLFTFVGIGSLALFLLGGIYFFFAQNFFVDRVVLTNENLLSTVYTKINDIETTNYRFDFTATVKERPAGMLSYSETFPASEAELLRYQRDYDRIRDITKIKAELDKLKPDYLSWNNTNTKDEVATRYPARLSDLGLNLADPLTGPYRYTPTKDYSSYTLEVTVETTEAYNALRYSSARYSSTDSGTAEKKTIEITPDSYLYTYGFTGKPTQPKLFGALDLSEVEQILPADISASLNFGGSVDTNTNKPTNAQLRIGGEVVFGDASFAFDAEGKKISANYYGILHKIPTFFSAVSQLRGKWVMLNEDDLRNYGMGDFYDYYVPSEENERAQKIKEAQEWFMRILQMAERLQVVKIVTGPVSDEMYGAGVSRYTLKLDKEQVYDFANEVITAFKGTAYEIPDREAAEILSYLQGEEFNRSFDYLNNMVTFTVWFDRQGYPIRLEQVVNYVPSPEARALANRMIEVVYSLELTDINKPLVLSVPEDHITFDELMTELTGLTIEELLVDRQESNIQSIRSGLSAYYEWTGVYPANLEELKKKHNEVTKKTDTTTQGYPAGFPFEGYDYRSERPFIRALPVDVYTKKPYSYQLVGETDYELTYTIEQVPYTKDKNPRNYFRFGSGNSYSDFDYVSGTPNMSIMLRKYVDGANTATKDHVSREAGKDLVDSDADGLSDSLERLFGTDPAKVDSDGDGFSDREEIVANSNPTGPGQLEYQRNSSFLF